MFVLGRDDAHTSHCAYERCGAVAVMTHSVGNNRCQYRGRLNGAYPATGADSMGCNDRVGGRARTSSRSRCCHSLSLQPRRSDLPGQAVVAAIRCLTMFG